MSTTTKLKKRFCKDNNVSINIFRNPYFESRLELLGHLDDYNNFLNMIKNQFDNSEEKYLEYYNSLKDNIIDFIKKSEAFEKLNNADMNIYACKFNIKQSDVYKIPNIGHRFISIDMVKANFSSLVHYSKCNNYQFFDSFEWESFMKQFTDIEYFYKSKYIRQVVLGNCNPKRQVTYEKYLMSELVLQVLLSDNIIDLSNVYSMCSDEIIINIDNMSEDKIKEIHTTVDFISKNCIPLRSTEFTLGKVVGTKAYIKHITNENCNNVDKKEFKCVEPLEAPFIYRADKGELPIEEDFYFVIDDKLAKLVEAPAIYIDYTKQEDREYAYRN